MDKKKIMKNVIISVCFYVILFLLINIWHIQAIADYKVLINVSVSAVRLCMDDIYGTIRCVI